MGKPIKGNAGPNTLIGTKNGDKIHGKGGDDTLEGRNGSDFLKGGTGDDLLRSGAGDDRSFGGPGNDTINGGHGNDFLFGGSGDDRLTGGGETDIMKGGSGKDVFRIDATGFENIIQDFKFGHGDRIEIPPEYAFADAVIVDNGNPHQGVTVSWGIDGPLVTILGVHSVSDVSSTWFI